MGKGTLIQNLWIEKEARDQNVSVSDADVPTMKRYKYVYVANRLTKPLRDAFEQRAAHVDPADLEVARVDAR